MTKKLISIVSPTYNEEDNIEELYARVVKSIDTLSELYEFEILVIDNHSVDSTAQKLKQIAEKDKRLKIIINSRNFGHIRSPYHGLMQSSGDAVIYLASDLQDPPELLLEFIAAWENGYKLVMAAKPSCEGSKFMHIIRRTYYSLLDSVSDVSIPKDVTGFGLYDKSVIKLLSEINDPYPFLRGLIAELGFPIKILIFDQPKRRRGISKNNFYTLYDIAWLGFVGHSKVPIRISAFVGFILGSTSIIAAFMFMIAKFLYWNSIPVGIAPLIIGMFFLFGVQFIFIGILGEYIGTILTYVQRRPVVVEKERINFE